MGRRFLVYYCFFPLLLQLILSFRLLKDTFWLWLWLFILAFTLFLVTIYPIFIAPLFNDFKPLEEGEVISFPSYFILFSSLLIQNDNNNFYSFVPKSMLSPSALTFPSQNCLLLMGLLALTTGPFLSLFLLSPPSLLML